jgi:hypothetical protein
MDFREKQLSAALLVSERTRRVLIILQTYAALLVVVYLNANDDWGGYGERRVLAYDARDMYLCAQPPPFVVEMPLHKGGDILARLAGAGRAAREHGSDEWARRCAQQAGLDPHRARAVAKWILSRRLSRHGVEDEIERVEHDMRENVYNIPIPLTGLQIDINTFSMVGSAGHFLLLVWLLLCVYQEQENMRLIQHDEELFSIVVRQMLFYPADNKRSGAIFALMRLSVATALFAPLLPIVLTAVMDLQGWDSAVGIFPSVGRVIALETAFAVMGFGMAAAVAIKITSPLVPTKSLPGKASLEGHLPH